MERFPPLHDCGALGFSQELSSGSAWIAAWRWSQICEGKTAANWHVKPYDYARPDSQGKLIWGQKSQIVHDEGVDASQFALALLPPS